MREQTDGKGKASAATSMVPSRAARGDPHDRGPVALSHATAGGWSKYPQSGAVAHAS
jgi:hypothetical protein